jgi:CBS domain-containing protein
MRTVADAMIATPVRVDPTATVQDASAAMLDAHSHAVVLVDGDRVRGIATAQDVARALAEGRDAAATPIAVVADRRPLVAAADEPLADAHQRMRAQHRPAVPVVAAGGRLVGLLVDPEA